jgi:hypothetical protein
MSVIYIAAIYNMFALYSLSSPFSFEHLRASRAHKLHLRLARIFHKLLAVTTDMAVLPGVLGCRPLRRTDQVRLGTNTLRLPGGTPIFVVSRQQFMKYSG